MNDFFVEERMGQLVIYLAGLIQRHHESEGQFCWPEDDLMTLSEDLIPLKPQYLNCKPNTTTRKSPLANFGRDLTQVATADIVLVDGRKKLGLGVGTEVMWAKMHRIPVLSLVPTEDMDTIHPFIHVFSDSFLENLDDIALWIKQWALGKKPSIIGPEIFNSALDFYKNEFFTDDRLMQTLVESNDRLKNKLQTTGLKNPYERQKDPLLT